MSLFIMYLWNWKRQSLSVCRDGFFFLIIFFFCLGTGKGEVYFSVEGDEGRSVSRATSCFPKANTRGLHGFLNEGCATSVGELLSAPSQAQQLLDHLFLAGMPPVLTNQAPKAPRGQRGGCPLTPPHTPLPSCGLGAPPKPSPPSAIFQFPPR